MVLKSPNDDREYKIIMLDNKLEVLMVHDKDINTSAAAMSVGVGSYSDTEQGIAHFLEHMLFMGTKKYPEEDYYHSFMADHGGVSNAFTDVDNTTYYFSIHTEHFDKALDIFSRFFIDPLLNKDAVDREIMAVNAEHIKNLNSDERRTFRILENISDSKHPFHKFKTGSLETLDKKNIYDTMINFYNEFYSSNIMKLVVVSNNSLQHTEETVNKLFNDIVNKNVVKKPINNLPFIFQDKGCSVAKLVEFVPVSDKHTVNIVWQVPNLEEYFYYKPYNYITHLIGHESENSLVYMLKEKGLITHMMIFDHFVDNNAYFITASYVLTDKGFENVPQIMKSTYMYIDMLKHSVDESVYNELKKTASINFKFIEKSNPIDYVVDLSVNMLKYPAEYVVSLPYIYNSFDKTVKKLIDKCFEHIDEKKSVVIISSKKYKDITDAVERHYEINYKLTHSPKNYGNMFSYEHDDTWYTDFPSPNMYIPKEAPKTVDSTDTGYPRRLDTGSKKIDVWHRVNTKFKHPKVVATFDLLTPDISSSVDNTVVTNIFVQLLNFYMRSDMYYAILADSSYTVKVHSDFIRIKIHCYNTVFEQIVKYITNTFFDLVVKEDVFDMMVEEYIVNLSNFVYKKPITHCTEFIKENSYHKYYTYLDRIKAVKKLKINDMEKVKSMFRKGCRLRSLVQGDISCSKVSRIVKMFNVFITEFSLIDRFATSSTHVVPLKHGVEEVYKRDNYVDSENNSAICVVYEIGAIGRSVDEWEKLTLCSMIVDTVVSDDFFNEMRTKAQLGYMVKSSYTAYGHGDKTVTGIMFSIQSPYKKPDVLLDKIKHFIDNVKIDNDIFKQCIETVVNRLKLIDVNLTDEFIRNYSEIVDGYYMFDIREKLIKSSSDISLEYFKEFYNKYFINKNSRKLRVSQMFSNSIKSKKD